MCCSADVSELLWICLFVILWTFKFRLPLSSLPSGLEIGFRVATYETVLRLRQTELLRQGRHSYLHCHLYYFPFTSMKNELLLARIHWTERTVSELCFTGSFSPRPPFLSLSLGFRLESRSCPTNLSSLFSLSSLALSQLIEGIGKVFPVTVWVCDNLYLETSTNAGHRRKPSLMACWTIWKSYSSEIENSPYLFIYLFGFVVFGVHRDMSSAADTALNNRSKFSVH